MKHFIALILFIALPASAGVVKVTSVYTDASDPKRELKVSGSGLIVKSGERQFVFTASHVSQGKNTEITLEGATLKILNRVLHGNNDLELLEVSGAPVSSVKAEFVNGRMTYDASSITRRRFIDRYNFVALLDWVNDPNLDADNVYGQKRGPVLAMDIFSTLLNADTIVQPGTSGAPLITTVPATWNETQLPYDVREGFRDAPAGGVFVRGLAIRRDRFFAHSSFVPAARLTGLLQNFLEGKSQPKIITTWHASGAILFRKGEVYQETAAYSSATAGGTVTDIGNGTTMEGGDLASLGEDSPKEFLEKVSAFPVTDGSTDPVMFWMLAMRHPRTSGLISLWSWFDMEIFPLFTRGGDIFASFVKESPDLDLAARINFRFGQRGDFELNSPAHLKKDATGIEFGIPLENGGKLNFKLTRNGHYGTATRFQPVIEVPSDGGQVYLVDLREFFFVNTVNSKTATLRDPAALNFTRDQLVGAVFDEMEAEIGRPRIIYRPKRAVTNVPMTAEQGQFKTVEW